MTVCKEDIVIVKEGKDYTIYLGEIPLTNISINNIIEELDELLKRMDCGESIDEIVKDYCEFI